MWGRQRGPGARDLLGGSIPSPSFFPIHLPHFLIAVEGAGAGLHQRPSKLPASIPDTQLGCRKRSEAESALLLLGQGALKQGLERSQADQWSRPP